MKEKVILSGNCSWTFEAVFQHIKGVTDVKSGTYSLKPYEFKFNEKDKVEAVSLEFDNSIVSLDKILDIFYAIHNPNINSWIEEKCFSYYHRSAIIVNKEQKEIADKKVKEVSDSQVFGDSTEYGGSVNTKVIIYLDNELFESIREKEKDFFKNNPKDPYSVSMILPKLKKIKEKFPHYFEGEFDE